MTIDTTIPDTTTLSTTTLSTTDPLDVLAALPERWQEVFDPMTVTVPCGGKDRHITWTPDGITCDDPAHLDAETALVALGGEPCPCITIVDAWTQDIHRSHSAGMLRWGTIRDIDTRDKISELLGDRFEDFAVRSGPRAATIHLVSTGMLAWMTRHSADPGEQPELFVRLGTDSETADGGQAMVGIHGGWASGTNAHLAVFIPHDWYDQVREHGPLRDERFFLGDAGNGPVVASLGITPLNDGNDPTTIGQIIGVLHTAPLPALTPGDHAAFANVTTEPARTGNNLILCGWNSWDYDDNNYYMNEGLQPVCVVASVTAAILWQNHYNIVEMHDVRLYEFNEHIGDDNWFGDLDIDTATFADVLALAARNAEPVTKYVIEFTAWQYIADRR